MSLSQKVVLLMAILMIGAISFMGVKEMQDPDSLYNTPLGGPQGQEVSGLLDSTKEQMEGFMDSMMDVFASFQAANWSDQDKKLDQNVRFQHVMSMILKILGILVFTAFIYLFLEMSKMKH